MKLLIFTFFAINILHTLPILTKKQKPHSIKQIKCIYQITFKPDSTNRQNIRNEKAILLTDGSTSKYYSLNKYLLDSTIQQLSSQPTQTITSINTQNFPKTSFSYVIYKSSANDNITTVDEIGNTSYSYIENFPKNNWQISNEKKLLLGYSCQKATISFSGRHYIAWFTKEIPYSDGPYKFYGLPGLIIEIQDVKDDYVFRIIQIKNVNSNTPIEINTNNTKKTNKLEFKKGLDYYRENYVDIQIQTGGIIYDNPEALKKRVKENNKRRNNPIELL